MLRNACLLSILVSALFLQVGCGPSKDAPSADTPEKKYPAAQTRPFEGVSEFPYTASQTKQDLVVSGHRTLRHGMTTEEVQALLGAPDMNQTMTDPQENITGYQLTYYLFRKEKEKFNVDDDVLVMITFDHDRQLQKVMPQNLRRLATAKEEIQGAREDTTPPMNPVKGH